MNRSASITSRIAQAREQAAGLVGLDDFGSTDDGHREALTAWLEAVDEEAELTPFGEQMLGQMVIGALVARLIAEKGFREHPAAGQARISKPIIVTGFTRSGTTALHKLLASAPGTQALEYWLTTFPMPRPPRESWNDLPPYRQTVAGLAQLYELAPEMRKIHYMAADEPDECWRVLSHSFMSYAVLGFVWAPTFGSWLAKADRGGAYARYRRVLQLIGQGNPSTWVLKDPMHLPTIDLVLEQFPDACIVHTCREPAEVMPSVCSLMHAASGPFQRNIDMPAFGRRIFEDYSSQMDQFMDKRSRLDPARFLDVQYEDVVSDPVSLARRIYAHFDIPIGTEGEARLRQWQAGRTQHQFGKHEYGLEEYGLRAEEINERLAAYRRAYLTR